ncbi:MAG: DUF4238 domain-containing protein, partial [Roseiarcus sp.]
MNSFANKGGGRSRQIHVFDKQNSNTFLSSIDNVFAERDFSTFESEVGTYCIEDSLGKLENAAAPLIERIVLNKKIEFTSDEDRATLAIFVVLHRIRGKSIRAEMEALASAARKVVEVNYGG